MVCASRGNNPPPHFKPMAAFMKLGDIKGEFAPSRKADGVSDQVAQFTTGGGGDSLTDAGLGNNSLREGANVWTNGSATSINDAPPVFKTGSNWDVICDIGTSIKQTSVADALTNYRPFSEMNEGDPFSELDQGVFAPVNVLRSDNRFVFEPLNAMNSFGDSFDPGLDGANGFKPREVSAVQIGNPPDPKLWLQMLG